MFIILCNRLIRDYETSEDYKLNTVDYLTEDNAWGYKIK